MPDFLDAFKKNKGKRLIFRASITVNGIKYYARDYGYRGFPLWV